MTRNVLVLGAGGMLGLDLCAELAARGAAFHGATREECDVTDAGSVAAALGQHRPAVVINCAAFTDVNGAESQQEEAFRLNRDGAARVAQACARADVRVLHVSTDYVFDGTKAEPYVETDATAPLNVYGASKLAGEAAVLAASPDHAVVRTSWLYGVHGRHFPGRILELARAGKPLRVVNDQTGAPTWTGHLARGLADLAVRPGGGIFHMTNGGACTWFEFAATVLELAGVQPVSLDPCAAAEFPAQAVRPANSRLADTRLAALGVAPLPHWRDGVREFLAAASLLPREGA